MPRSRKNPGRAIVPLIAVGAVLIMASGFYLGATSGGSSSLRASRRSRRKGSTGSGGSSSISIPEDAHPTVQPIEKGEGLAPCSIAASSDGATIYVAGHSSWQVAVVSAGTGKVEGKYALPGPPGQVVLSPDQKSLYVTQATYQGAVHVLDANSGKVTKSVDAGHTPTGLAVTADGKTLHVCSRFTNQVLSFDTTSLQRTAEYEVNREPVAVVATADGSRLFVANHLSAGGADAAHSAATVSMIDVASKKVTQINLPLGGTNLQDICISPDGNYVYAPHVLSRFQLPATQLERGWMNTSAVTIIAVASGKVDTTVLLDDVDLGAANPWGVACTADGKHLCVAHAGTHEVSVIDRVALHDKIEKVRKGEKVAEGVTALEHIPNDLSFVVGMRHRVKLEGHGPRGIAVAGAKVFAAEYFTDTVGEVDVAAPEAGAKSIALGPKPTLSDVRRGEMIFNDASICFQSWQSCATCHPDGRADALNWDTVYDGIGNPRSAKSTLLSHRTPPTMAAGLHPDAKTSVRKEMHRLLFAQRPEEDAVAVDAYLSSLRPVPSPYLVDGRLSEAAARGEAVFQSAGCAKCHAGEMFTDLKPHEVGTGIGSEQGKEFDTPTLVEVWRTAPYLIDGRAASIADVLTEHNKGDKHGKTSGLDAKQISDLAEFVLSQ